MRKKVPQKIQLTVVGLQYRVTMSTRRMIADKLDKEGPVKCLLEREPNNPHDSMAIRVVISEGPYRNLHIGYLRRVVSQVWGKLMDSGKLVFKEAYLLEVWPHEGEAEILVTVKHSGEKTLENLLKENA